MKTTGVFTCPAEPFDAPAVTDNVAEVQRTGPAAVVVVALVVVVTLAVVVVLADVVDDDDEEAVELHAAAPIASRRVAMGTRRRIMGSVCHCETLNDGTGAAAEPGAPGGIRTPDTWLRKPVLYPLSY